MSPERWMRIKGLFGDAMAREGADREAFLRTACGADADLRAEVETLLQEHDGAALRSPIQPDCVGLDIGHFHITEKIGEGGMGVVYRALDRKLSRDVAIKMLPPEVSKDAERLARFRGEARALAQLNHPNVASIYGIKESQGRYAVVMELVEGPTLADRIAKGALSPEEALSIALQIAEGIEEAHWRGIVHRDLKPANIKVARDGRVKVLDFGLAKALHWDAGIEDAGSPPSTVPGTVMGTLVYMAPEQARGERVDARADIWSFGVVLFEMLSTKRPFGGETASDKLAAVLKEEPDWEKLPGNLSAKPRDLLRRCLRKDRKLRLQSMGDVRIALQEALEEERKPPPRKGRLHQTMVPALATAVAGALLGGLAVWHSWPADHMELPVRRFTIRPQGSIQVRPFGNAPAAISPNGKHIAFVATAAQTGRSQLWIHDLDREAARLVSGSDGAQGPFWSPDSETVAFFTETTLLKTQSRGGHPVPVCGLPAEPDWGGAWSPNGQSMVFAAGNPSRLYAVPTSGGAAKPLMSEQAVDTAFRLAGQGQGRRGYFGQPHFLASAGRSVLAYALGYASHSLMLQDLESGQIELLGPGNSPFNASPEILLFSRPGTSDLWAIPLSPRSLKADGEAFLVATGGMKASSSQDGTLVYVDSPNEQLAWFDRGGRRMETIGEPVQGVYYPAISPDGRRVALETNENGNMDIWVQNLDRGSRTRLTSDPATDLLPAWSPSGEEVVFGSYRSGSVDIWLRRADSGTEERMISGAGRHRRVSDWSKDGKYILFTAADGSGGSDVRYLTRGADEKWEPQSFLSTHAVEAVAKFSPDGRYVAYLSDESGRMELYVREFPRGDRKWALSSNGAAQPRWSRDGKEIFYSENGSLVAVPVTTTPSFSAGIGVRLFHHDSIGRNEREPNYDVSADRQRILLPEMVRNQEIQIHVVQNWLAEFRASKK